MSKYLKLIRFQNLMIIALTQLIVKFCIIDSWITQTALNNFQFTVLVLSTLFIASGGYIINNIIDVETDRINKPQNLVIGTFISEDKAYNLFYILNFLGVIGGFYLSNVIEKPSFLLIFILTSASLYLYATFLKQNFLIGNILVALLTALSILIVPIFDLFPLINFENKMHLKMIFSIILDYALFALVLNFIREIIKDSEDIVGDRLMEMKTLPIIIGIPILTKILSMLLLIFAVYLSYYIYEYYMTNNLHILSIFCIIFILAPLLYCCLFLWQSRKNQHFKLLSSILKGIILMGIISILILKINIRLNA